MKNHNFDSSKKYLELYIESDILDFSEHLNSVYIYVSDCKKKVETAIYNAYKHNNSIEFVCISDTETYLCKGVPTMVMIGMFGQLNYFRLRFEDNDIQNITRLYKIGKLLNIYDSNAKITKQC